MIACGDERNQKRTTGHLGWHTMSVAGFAKSGDHEAWVSPWAIPTVVDSEQLTNKQVQGRGDDDEE